MYIAAIHALLIQKIRDRHKATSDAIRTGLNLRPQVHGLHAMDRKRQNITTTEPIQMLVDLGRLPCGICENGNIRHRAKLTMCGHECKRSALDASAQRQDSEIGLFDRFADTGPSRVFIGFLVRQLHWVRSSRFGWELGNRSGYPQQQPAFFGKGWRRVSPRRNAPLPCSGSGSHAMGALPLSG